MTIDIRPSVLALLVPVGLLIISSNARAAVLCKKKSGVIAVRDACKGKETRLDPDALGLRGTQGPDGGPGPTGGDGPQGPAGPQGPGLVVKDANGTFVGLPNAPDLLDTGAALPVVRRVGNTLLLFSIHLGDSRLYGHGGQQLLLHEH